MRRFSSRANDSLGRGNLVAGSQRANWTYAHYEQAIADALESKKIKKLPVKPREEITHLMAKAAVAVYEGVVEGRDG